MASCPPIVFKEPDVHQSGSTPQHEANKNELAAQALESIGVLYGIEKELKNLPDKDHQRLRNENLRPSAMPCING